MQGSSVPLLVSASSNSPTTYVVSIRCFVPDVGILRTMRDLKVAPDFAISFANDFEYRSSHNMAQDA